MHANTESFENGHFAGAAMFRHNAATLSLDSDSTGLWITIDAKVALPEFKFTGKNSSVKITVFESHGYPDEFNKQVNDCSDVLSCAFSLSNRLVFRNCFPVDFNRGLIKFSGLVVLESEYEKDKFTAVRSFKSFDVINTGTYLAQILPLNKTFPARIVMNSILLDENVSEFLGKDNFDFSEPKTSAAHKSGYLSRFARSLSFKA